MSVPLLLFVAGIYVWVAIGYVLKGNPGMGLAFAAYAVSNVGFVWATLRGGV